MEGEGGLRFKFYPDDIGTLPVILSAEVLIHILIGISYNQL